jgi:succinoglycan biosynthesis transport protein ExoP
MSSKSESTDAHGPLRALRRRIRLILLCCLMAAAAAFAYSVSQTKEYSATASLLFRDPGFVQQVFGASTFQSTDPTREAATNVGLVALDVVADRTATAVGDGLTGPTVSSEVTVEAQGASNLASVTATDPSASFAARLANEYARQYVLFRRNADRRKIAEGIRLVTQDYSSLSPEEQAADEGRSLQHQISQLRTLQALQTGNAEVVQTADVPSSPSSPQTKRNTALGALLGLLLGGALALVFERFDRRLKDPKELEESFSLPLLAGIPDSKGLRISANGSAALSLSEAEAFRMLRTRLRYFNVDRNLRSVLITSPAAQDGKTTVSWYLARSNAEAGVKTILIEADFHRPTVAERRGLAPLPGLSELLSGQARLESVIQEVPVSSRANGHEAEDHVDVIVAGATPPNPSQIMESEEMARLLSTLSNQYELVVIDTPPAVLVADAIPLMKLVDGVIVVGQMAKTTRDQATHLRDQLQELDAPMLGVVANRARTTRGYGGYDGYYGNGSKGRRRLLLFGRRG